MDATKFISIWIGITVAVFLVRNTPTYWITHYSYTLQLTASGICKRSKDLKKSSKIGTMIEEAYISYSNIKKIEVVAKNVIYIIGDIRIDDYIATDIYPIMLLSCSEDFIISVQVKDEDKDNMLQALRGYWKGPIDYSYRLQGEPFYAQ